MSLLDVNSVARRSHKALKAVASATCDLTAATTRTSDDFSRKVYCVLGIPIDAIDMTAALRTVKAAARGSEPFLLSTANLNFLVTSRSDSEFRESLLDSDLCTADGMPIVWIARLLGLPIENRVSGSDLFEELRTAERGARPLTVFWFGGAAGVAAVAAEKINGKSAGLRCVGSIDPGFGTVEEMSRDALLNPVNASGADFLVVSLGAKKGQLWLQQNRDRLRSPVRAHLGTVVNFQAGTLRRAPRYLQSWGLEWLWRIKEEPYLWRRYWSDGCVLLALVMKRILPLAIATYLRPASRAACEDLAISTEQSSDTFIIRLSGAATERHVDKAISCFRSAVASRNEITIDLSDTSTIDARFLGLLLILRKQLKRQHGRLTFIGASRRVAKLFRYNELSFLLAADSGVQSTTSSRARADIPASYCVGGVARNAKPHISLYRPDGDQNQ
jgi:N-acetylglucosaminyldiphosphoundecaprenol N-acetyl-beta-D-mannosaminyltransferase